MLRCPILPSASFGDTTNSTYVWDRGAHISQITSQDYGQRFDELFGTCVGEFFGSRFGADFGESMALALAEADGDCAKMLLSAGLVDRDLGKSSVGALWRIL